MVVGMGGVGVRSGWWYRKAKGGCVAVVRMACVELVSGGEEAVRRKAGRCPCGVY